MITESLVSKMFKHFGKTTFRPGSLRFIYEGDLYEIHSVNETQLFYGNDGWSLKSDNSSQFEIFKVEATSRLCAASSCTLFIRERDRVERRR